jgi:predicted nicotinamide N-methyase
MLYYVRFFKVPTINKAYINAVVTLTNDLGELFFYGNATIECYLNEQKALSALQWKPGMRSCEIQLTVSDFNLKRLKGQDLILTVKVDYSSGNSPKDLLFTSSNPSILEVQSMPISSDTEKYSSRSVYGVTIVEQTGHNIARKLWDAGISLSLYLKEHGNTLFRESKHRKLNVLELGTGCGIVSITIAQLLGHSVRVTATDLADARDVLERSSQANGTDVSFEEFNWDNDPKSLSQTQWDWILISDCTYNPDSYESLIKALLNVAIPHTRILVAHKYRHKEEDKFFEIVKNSFSFVMDNEVNYLGQNVRIVELKLERPSIPS